MHENRTPRRGRRTTGGITEHRGRDGKTYRTLRFTAHGKRRTEPLGAVTKAEAEAARRGILADIERGIWKPPSAAPVECEAPTFGAFAEEWAKLNWPQLRPATRADYKWRLDSHLLPFFGELTVMDIDIDAVDRYRAAKLAEGERIRAAAEAGEPITERVTNRLGHTYSRELCPLSDRSINMTLVLLASILETAVERDLIARNPAAGKRRRVRERKPRRSYLDTAGQIAALLDAGGELDREARADRQHVRRRGMLAVLAFAGLRTDELFELRVSGVNLAAGWLHVPGTKTDTAERYVKIRGALRDELAAVLAVAPDPAGRLFPSATGKKMSDDNFRRRVFHPAVKRASEARQAAGQPPLPDGLEPKSLRHTFCSTLYALGADPGTVMDEMGHTDPALALRVYRHAMRRVDGDKAALRALVEGPASDPAALAELTAAV